MTTVLEGTPCDVALLVSRDAVPEGPVAVPFGRAEHDWAAVELGAWFARAANAATTRRCRGSTLTRRARRKRPALARALAVQRVLGVSAEPLLTPPGEEDAKVSHDAGLLVVGLSTSGTGRASAKPASAPPTGHTALTARARGLRPGGLAPPATLTRFTWSIRPRPCSG